jgi:peptidase M23-like protein/LysM domain-containing protein
MKSPRRRQTRNRAPALAALLVASALSGGYRFAATTRSVKGPKQPLAASGPIQDGVCHVLREGETLYSLSKAFGIPLETLVSFNDVADPDRISAGEVLFIPGARRPLRLPSRSRTALAWPIAGEITSPFGSDGRRPHHEGLDIGGEMGEEVHAAGAGTVLWTGVERGYGKTVVLDHGGGLTTLYAHASEILVMEGDRVEAGDPVARVGRSGNASGAHLHFEVRKNGLPVNPLPFLSAPVARASRTR